MSTEPDFRPLDVADKLRIIKRFPDRWAGISALYEDSESFRMLCHEYGLAAKVLAKLNREEGDHSSGRCAEYWQLVHELESEILKFINRDNGISSRKESVRRLGRL